MSKDEKSKYTRRMSSGSRAENKKSFYQRLKYKITSSQRTTRRRNMRRERFEQLNESRRKRKLNEIKMKFIRGENPIPKDYIPIAITPKGVIVCIHEETDGSVHPDLAKVMFPDYKNPVVKAIASSYTLVAPIGSSVTLCYAENQFSLEEAEKQRTARDKIERRFEGIKISDDTISQELLKRLEPEAQIVEKKSKTRGEE